MNPELNKLLDNGAVVVLFKNTADKAIALLADKVLKCGFYKKKDTN